MLKYILLFFFLFATSLQAQELVTTDPQSRNLVLEEFTGIHCGNCPGGHRKAKEIADANPGRVVLISIHEGSYAVPKQGEPDFRTQWGSAFLQMSGVTGFPCGLINRERFTGAGKYPYYVQRENGMALSVPGWESAVYDRVLNEELSPVNVGARASWNNDTRELEIEVEAYFTDDVAEDINLNIALLESHIWGPQLGAENPSNYEHNHVLRDMITGQWGEQIESTTKGTLFEKTYKYLVDAAFDIVNCDLAIFITENNSKRIISGIDIMAIPPKSNITLDESELISTKAESTRDIAFELENISQIQTTFEISFEKSEKTPDDWEIVFTDGLEYIVDPMSKISIPAQLKTASGKGIGEYRLVVSEKDNPISNTTELDFTAVTTDINYLEVNAGGSDLADLQAVRNGFISLGLEDYGIVSQALKEIDVLCWNSGPKGRITSADASLLLELIESGTGVVFTGSGAITSLALNEPDHQLLDLLGISWEFTNEINLQTFTLEGVVGDPISDGIFLNDLSVANNGYLMQKLNITDFEIASTVLVMKENGATISSKTENQFSRSVYLGYNPAILTESARNELLAKSIDWIENKTSVQEEKSERLAMRTIRTASGIKVIINNLGQEFFQTGVGIYDITGRRLYSGTMDIASNAKSEKNIDINLFSGFYIIRVYANDKSLINKIIY
jgi:hypothetical protein